MVFSSKLAASENNPKMYAKIAIEKATRKKPSDFLPALYCHSIKETNAALKPIGYNTSDTSFFLGTVLNLRVLFLKCINSN